MQNQGSQEVTDEIFSLACGLDRRVMRYTSCIVNGVRYHTKERDFHLRSQNSGVMVEENHEEEDIDFYGVLIDIIQLDYIKECQVVLFRCEWFDLDNKKRRIRKDGHLVSINVNKCWYDNDPFILAIQAKQVFYLDDIRLGRDWRVVQKFHHRHLYDVPEAQHVENGEMFDLDNNIDQEIELFYNDNTMPIEEFEEGPLNKDDIALDVIDSDLVEKSSEDACMDDLDEESQQGLEDCIKEDCDCFECDSDIDPLL